MKMKAWMRRAKSNLSIIRELLTFFWQNKLWWMIPMIVVFLLLGFFIIFTQSAAVVPFIYTLF
ncbi:MAG: DUF5989 family protein [Candidatus Omnitrophota bacterium]|nr:hypothetical protein [Candidatus Omnitrophota bacterium]